MEPKQPPAADPRCGTYAGYFAHRHAGEKACQPCIKAASAYRRANSAISRNARRRLGEMYPDDYRRLLEEERAKAAEGDAE